MKRALLVVSLVAAADAPAADDACRVAYGAVADLDHCATATLPDFTARFTGHTQPTPGIPLTCRNYEARSGAATATFKQCSTGVLGGRSAFTLGAKAYTVVFDVGSGCTRTPGGNFAPATRGHVFFAGEPPEGFDEKQSQREAACFARKH
jgi:hypothetical protein